MPDVREPIEEALLGSNAEEDDRYAELLLAGFQACAREALRFLLEEEGLAPDHPLPAGLNEHLVRQQCHLADTLQNDSGIDLEESFMDTPSDGATTTDERLVEVSELQGGDELVTNETVLGILLNMISNQSSCETDAVERTEMHDRS